MKYLASRLGATKFIAPIRSIYLESRTGILHVEGPSLKKRLYFVSGELHLRRSDLPLAQKIATYLGESDQSPSSPQQSTNNADLKVLTRLIAEHWTVWKATSFHFIEGLDTSPGDLLGPLPTARLLIAATTAAGTEDQIFDLLGGAEAQVVAVPASRAPRGSTITRVDEALFLTLCQQPARLGELLEKADGGQKKGLEILCRLWVTGLVRTLTPDEVLAEAPPTIDLREIPAAPETEAAASRTAGIYQQHFRLTGDPFSLTPDPAFLFLSKAHSEALSALEIGLLEKRGLTVLTGEVGTGKTTLLYSLLSRIGPEVETAYVANTTLSFDEILQAVLKDFDVDFAGLRRVDLLEALNDFLLRSSQAGKTVALVVDEAQALSAEAFEGLRQLLNFETYEKKLLQIFLVGQPELGTRLKEASLRQVADRIAVRCHLRELRSNEVRSYIDHRLEAAGAHSEIFTRAALRLIVAKSRGIPRSINVLCHNAMVFAFAKGQTSVDRSLVREAIRERSGRVSRGPLHALMAAFRHRTAWGLIASLFVLWLAVSAGARRENDGIAQVEPEEAATIRVEPGPRPTAGAVEPAGEDPLVEVADSPDQESAKKAKRETSANLNVRSGPSLDSTVMTTLPQGTEVIVLDEDGEWSIIRSESHGGWVMNSYLLDPTRNEALE